MKFILLLNLFSLTARAFLGGLFDKLPVYDSNLDSMEGLDKIMLEMEIKQAHKGGTKKFFAFVKETYEKKFRYLYLKDKDIDKFLNDPEIRPEFLKLYSITDRQPKSPLPPPPPPPKPTMSDDEFLSQMGQALTGGRLLKKKAPKYSYRFKNKENRRDKIKRDKSNYKPRDRKLYDVRVKPAFKHSNKEEIFAKPRKLDITISKDNVNDPNDNIESLAMDKTRTNLIKDVLKNTNPKIQTKLTPQELQYLYSLSNNTATSPKDQDDAVNYGACMCQSKLQKKLFYNLVRNIDYKRLTRPIAGALAAFAGYRLLKQPKEEYGPKISDLKFDIEELDSEVEDNRNKKYDQIKNIVKLIDEMEAFVNHMAFELTSKARTLNSIAWKKLNMLEETGKKCDEEDENCGHDDSQEHKNENHEDQDAHEML